MDKMDLCSNVMEDLKIPKAYVKELDKCDRCLVFVHQSWIRTLIRTGTVTDFMRHATLSSSEIQAKLKLNETLGSQWCRVFITVLPKYDKRVVPLPRQRSFLQSSEEDLTYSQILQYISFTNHKNLWKDSSKKYSARYVSQIGSNGNSCINLIQYDTAVRDIITRTYGCSLIRIYNGYSTILANNTSLSFEPHPNVLPANVVIEAGSFFYILQETSTCYSLQDCVNFSPAVLEENYKVLFIAYQLLKVMRDMHDRGLAVGDITLSDVLISDNLWIQVIPRLGDNIYDPPKTTTNNEKPVVAGKRTPTTTPNLSDFQSKNISQAQATDVKSSEFLSMTDIGYYCEQWVQGAMSNFDYIIILNKLAGHKYGDPRSHYVFPWVSDFTSRNGLNWRDMTRSKFRLNKGDRQLDLTYELSITNEGQVPHHISDTLCEITYYVYLARVTPKSVLCKYVRSQWVPAEYPVSIQRLQQWSPDECIPEFFTDVSIFKSIHPDLADLEIPSWANSTQDFINCHRAALESVHVSERLHHWIDLTFGYKLSGSAAVKCKNVCLQLVDRHTNLTTSGVMQLFTYPHPQKFIASPYLSKSPPRVFKTSKSKEEVYVDEEEHSSEPEESESQISSGLIVPKFHTSSTSNEAGINLHLPHDFNPIQSLISYENTYTFITKTFNKVKVNLQNIRPEGEKNSSTLYKQVVATRRAQEMLVFGCILVELFMSPKLRAVGSNLQVSSFKRRLETCRSLLRTNHDDIPKCIRSAVTLLLQTDSNSGVHTSAAIRTYPVTNFGIPPPSAHQLLLPCLSSHLLPIPSSFPDLYMSLKTLQDFISLRDELKYVIQGSSLSDTTFKNAIIMISTCIYESRVNELAKSIETLEKSDKMTIFLNNVKWMDFILPHLLEMLGNSRTDVRAAWFLLEPATRVLGPEKSVKILLTPTMKLYEYEFKCEETKNCEQSEYDVYRDDASKRIKLYHRSFLLRLIVGFGLKIFLENIITFLIEAVGGYQDEDDDRIKVNANYRIQRLKEVGNVFYFDEGAEVSNRSKFQIFNDSPISNVIGNDSKKKTAREVATGIVVPTSSSCSSYSSSPSSSPFVVTALTSADTTALNNHFEDAFDTVFAASAPELLEDFTSDGDNLTLNESGMKLDNKKDLSYNSEDHFIELIPAHKNVTVTSTISSKEESTERGINELRKIAEVSAESVTWLAHRLGPLLTARYLTKNLLRMLTLCYASDPFVEKKSIHIVNCLINIAGIYGEQLVVLQYIPQISDLISTCKKNRMTCALEGGLVGYINLFKYIISFLSTSTLKELMQESLCKLILHPAIRIMASTKILFPSGSAARSSLACKLIDCLYILGMRLGHSISRPLQRFFVTFDKLRLSETWDASDPLKKFNNFTEGEKVLNSDSTESPNSPSPVLFQDRDKEQLKIRAVEELCKVLTPELAYEAYSIFARYFGDSFMQRSLINLDFIQQLCSIYKEDKRLFNHLKLDLKDDIKVLEEYDGSHATVSGNKIHFGDSNIELVNECREVYDESRHLKGNWLAYWEHDLVRSPSDKGFNFQQIKLQGFLGHTNTVKSMQILDNENSFMSGSRDKTVKLWSLRNQGDGSTNSACQYTYTNHHKSVLSLGFCERTRLVASCDSTIHLWDPFIGRLISVVKNGFAVNTLVPLPAPNASIIAANTHASLNVLDTRTSTYVLELKACVNASGLIRSIAVSRNSSWVAIGQSSGTMSVLDLRTGNIISTWKGHEGEVLQLIVGNENTLITSSLDQSISVWNVSDGKMNFNMKGPIEPVHCLARYENELISGTTANRIGVHTNISHDASFSSTKLRSDTFKGVLTSISVLPLNRLLLLGADTGYITLIC